MLGALACEKAGISPEFFIEITMEIYGPLLFLLLILAGLTGKGKDHKDGASDAGTAGDVRLRNFFRRPGISHVHGSRL